MRHVEQLMMDTGATMRTTGAFISFAALAVICSGEPLAFAQDHAATDSPEIKKTVDAFLGHWKMTGNYREANARGPVSLTSRMDCELTARGRAVTCHVVTDGSDGSRVELTSVVGFSPDEGLVRLMEISSSGSYHDHRGRWRGNTIVFEPLTYSVSGKRTTEQFSIGISPAGSMTIKSTEKGTEGESTMALSGTRIPAS
jgi:hypothetical protein